MSQKKRILFLCTGNSCRSQMAQGIMNKIGGDRFEAFSAGSHPAGYVHPLAIETIREMGIDIASNVSKSLDEYVGQPWDIIVTVCDNAREACPVFPGQPISAHWGFEDPAHFEGPEDQKRRFFRSVAMEIEGRIRLLLALRESAMSQFEYAQEVKAIGHQ